MVPSSLRHCLIGGRAFALPPDVVFVQVADPVGAGLVASLAQPGGNATGFSVFASA